MAVIVRPKQQSGLSKGLGFLGTIASFIPGGQMIGAGLNAASSLTNDASSGGGSGSQGPIYSQEEPVVNQGSTAPWLEQWNKQQQSNLDPQYGGNGMSLLMQQILAGGR